jgi:hypothetical protein
MAARPLPPLRGAGCTQATVNWPPAWRLVQASRGPSDSLPMRRVRLLIQRRAVCRAAGIGRTLDPDFKFAAVAAPYAQELLDLQARGLVCRVG